MLLDLGFDNLYKLEDNKNYESNQKNENINSKKEESNSDAKSPDSKKHKKETSSDNENDQYDKTSAIGEENESGDENADYEKSHEQSKRILDDYKYDIFTKEYDEIIDAQKLCDIQELEKLREALDRQVFSFQPLIAKLANKLQRKLLSKQNRYWEFNLEEGYLDNSRLARFIANPKNILTFKKEKTTEFKRYRCKFIN